MKWYNYIGILGTVLIAFFILEMLNLNMLSQIYGGFLIPAPLMVYYMGILIFGLVLFGGSLLIQWADEKEVKR